MSALQNTGYALLPVYAAQIVAGLMLLSRRWVSLALLLLAPVTLNILCYDMFLNPSWLIIGLGIATIHAALFYGK